MDIFKDVFTTTGRLNRRMHFKYQMIWTTLVVLAVLTCQFLFGFLTGVPDNELGKSLSGFLFIIGFAGFCMILTRRLHDLNMSGYLGLLTFVPLLGIFFFLYMFMVAGTAGANKYGEEPSDDED